MGYDPNAAEKGFEGMMQHPPGLIYAGHHPTSPDAGMKPSPDGEKHVSSGSMKDGKRTKKAEPLFLGIRLKSLRRRS